MQKCSQFYSKMKTIFDAIFRQDKVRKPSHATVPVKETFTDPATGRGWVEGQVYRRPALADTLEQLAEAGDGLADLFYRGAIGRQLVAEVSV